MRLLVILERDHDFVALETSDLALHVGIGLQRHLVARLEAAGRAGAHRPVFLGRLGWGLCSSGGRPSVPIPGPRCNVKPRRRDGLRLPVCLARLDEQAVADRGLGAGAEFGQGSPQPAPCRCAIAGIAGTPGQQGEGHGLAALHGQERDGVGIDPVGRRVVGRLLGLQPRSDMRSGDLRGHLHWSGGQPIQENDRARTRAAVGAAEDAGDVGLPPLILQLVILQFVIGLRPQFGISPGQALHRGAGQVGHTQAVVPGEAVLDGMFQPQPGDETALKIERQRLAAQPLDQRAAAGVEFRQQPGIADLLAGDGLDPGELVDLDAAVPWALRRLAPTGTELVPPQSGVAVVRKAVADRLARIAIEQQSGNACDVRGGTAVGGWGLAVTLALVAAPMRAAATWTADVT